MNPGTGENPGGTSTSFFHGHYGGPRANVYPGSLVVNNQKYVFTKSKSENVVATTEAKQSPPIPRTYEPLNDEILDGCANLFDQTGKRVQVILRDGRVLIGELASVDVFSNLILRDAVERIFVDKKFGDIVRGIFIIRGDNLVLIGEVDCEKEAEMERTLDQVTMDEILLAQKLQQEAEYAKQSKYADGLKQRGVSFPRPMDEEF